MTHTNTAQFLVLLCITDVVISVGQLRHLHTYGLIQSNIPESPTVTSAEKEKMDKTEWNSKIEIPTRTKEVVFFETLVLLSQAWRTCRVFDVRQSQRPASTVRTKGTAV